jgi:hypothetical protein
MPAHLQIVHNIVEFVPLVGDVSQSVLEVTNLRDRSILYAPTDRVG